MHLCGLMLRLPHSYSFSFTKHYVKLWYKGYTLQGIEEMCTECNTYRFKEGNITMSNNSSDKGTSTQSQTNQSQPPKNPLLNRPTNPNLDITIRKGHNKPDFERKNRASKN